FPGLGSHVKVHRLVDLGRDVRHEILEELRHVAAGLELALLSLFVADVLPFCDLARDILAPAQYLAREFYVLLFHDRYVRHRCAHVRGQDGKAFGRVNLLHQVRYGKDVDVEHRKVEARKVECAHITLDDLLFCGHHKEVHHAFLLFVHTHDVVAVIDLLEGKGDDILHLQPHALFEGVSFEEGHGHPFGDDAVAREGRGRRPGPDPVGCDHTLQLPRYERGVYDVPVVEEVLLVRPVRHGGEKESSV